MSGEKHWTDDLPEKKKIGRVEVGQFKVLRNMEIPKNITLHLKLPENKKRRKEFWDAFTALILKFQPKNPPDESGPVKIKGGKS